MIFSQNILFSFAFRIDKAQTTEELADVYAHFELYYGREIPKMFELERLKQERGEGGDLGVESSVASQQLLKQASRRDGYSICQAASLGECFVVG